MAFWALGAFDKVKNMSITNVTKKLKDYVHVAEKQESTPKPIDSLPEKIPKKRLTSAQLMQIQLGQYKKMLELQEKVVESHRRKETEQMERRSRHLEQLNKELMETEIEERKSREKEELLSSLQQGKRTINDIIEENILIKEKLFLSAQE